MDKSRLERGVVHTQKFIKRHFLGKGKHWQLPDRIGFSLGAEMKHDLL